MILGCPQVLLQEVLLGRLLGLHLAHDVLGELVRDSATADLRDLVLWMRATNLVGPLHFFCLDDHSANLGLAVLSWRKGDDEICTFFTIGCKTAILGLDEEFRS